MHRQSYLPLCRGRVHMRQGASWITLQQARLRPLRIVQHFLQGSGTPLPYSGLVATWTDVVTIGSRFPGVEESTSYGTPALKVRGKMMCRLRTDPDALVVRVLDVGDREALLRGDPSVYFTTPPDDGYPYVLVRLEGVKTSELGELV